MSYKYSDEERIQWLQSLNPGFKDQTWHDDIVFHPTQIIYSGVFKEKLIIYKELIIAMDDLRDLAVGLGHSGNFSHEETRKVMLEFNKFIRLNKVGSIFYGEVMTSKVRSISDEIKVVLDLSMKANFFKANEFKNHEFEQYLDKLTI